MIPDTQNMLSHSLKIIFTVFGIEKNVHYFYKGQELASDLKLESDLKKRKSYYLCQLID